MMHRYAKQYAMKHTHGDIEDIQIDKQTLKKDEIIKRSRINT